RLDGAIEAARFEVTAADHRAHVAGRRLERDERGLQRIRWFFVNRLPGGDPSSGGAPRQPGSAPALDRSDLVRGRRLRGPLHRHADSRDDAKAARIPTLPAEAVDELTPHLLLEVLSVRLARAQ